ncbi:WhiB family transcriptional regulator [Actinokineospora spheciospongiae]|uniref:WhiB family transcriptional regulator n=1 Tax=Actinokineospora spheciospongiae TaxID=909613 RepID=UPI000D814BE8|nr:WhiB family transcriptional regulator [Actinokineospora spheciospongiae]PWW65611.1 WhiB family redox-sensing transcriptional regulator [Actinokineospora spheciospongiae]
MNEYTPPDRYHQLAAELNCLAFVPDDVLLEIVIRDGACMGLFGVPVPAAIAGARATDRELAADVCAGCPVRRECLEADMRTNGPQPLGVWGALNEDDRRALYPIWLAHRSAEELQSGGGE